jgi:hypothetical protein
MKYAEIVPELVEKVPELRELYQDHLESYDEILPHVFLGDVAMLVSEKVPDKKTKSQKTVKEILAFLEEQMSSGDPRVPELVAVSFLEVLDPQEDYYQPLKKLLGKKMLATLNQIETE